MESFQELTSSKSGQQSLIHDPDHAALSAQSRQHHIRLLQLAASLDQILAREKQDRVKQIPKLSSPQIEQLEDELQAKQREIKRNKAVLDNLHRKAESGNLQMVTQYEDEFKYQRDKLKVLEEENHALTRIKASQQKAFGKDEANLIQSSIQNELKQLQNDVKHGKDACQRLEKEVIRYHDQVIRKGNHMKDLQEKMRKHQEDDMASEKEMQRLQQNKQQSKRQFSELSQDKAHQDNKFDLQQKQQAFLIEQKLFELKSRQNFYRINQLYRREVSKVVHDLINTKVKKITLQDSKVRIVARQGREAPKYVKHIEQQVDKGYQVEKRQEVEKESVGVGEIEVDDSYGEDFQNP